MKAVFHYNIKTKELLTYFWPEKGNPPPLIEPQIKKREMSKNQEEKEEKN